MKICRPTENFSKQLSGRSCACYTHFDLASHCKLTLANIDLMRRTVSGELMWRFKKIFSILSTFYYIRYCLSRVIRPNNTAHCIRFTSGDTNWCHAVLVFTSSYTSLTRLSNRLKVQLERCWKCRPSKFNVYSLMLLRHVNGMPSRNLVSMFNTTHDTVGMIALKWLCESRNTCTCELCSTFIRAKELKPKASDAHDRRIENLPWSQSAQKKIVNKPQ